MNRIIVTFSWNFATGNVKEMLKRQWSRKLSCVEMEAVKQFCYVGDWVSASGGCEAGMIARTRCGLVKFRECGVLLYGWRFPLMLKEVVYEIYVMPAILYGSEAWCLNVNEMGILRTTETYMLRIMCGVHLKARKRAMDLMLTLGLNDTMDQLVVADSVHWYGHVLRRKDGHVFGRTFD